MKYPLLAALALTVLSMGSCKNRKTSAPAEGDADTVALTQVKFQADSAYAHVEAQCAFGPRVPDSEAHRACADYIVNRFKQYGLQVTEQKADLKAWDGKVLHSRNIIAAYRPEATERILLCAHWDSRPWADADPDSANHRKPVMAANDGASGVAVLLELARLMPQLNPAVGVDFICFDSEDYGAPYWAEDKAPHDGSDWCLGSTVLGAQSACRGLPRTLRHSARHGGRQGFLPVIATKAFRCAMPVRWWCACGTLHSVWVPETCSCSRRAAMRRTTMCP